MRVEVEEGEVWVDGQEVAQNTGCGAQQGC